VKYELGYFISQKATFFIVAAVITSFLLLFNNMWHRNKDTIGRYDTTQSDDVTPGKAYSVRCAVEDCFAAIGKATAEQTSAVVVFVRATYIPLFLNKPEAEGKR
jgi:hypothetical protein